MFGIGDTVVHRHTVCKITDIHEQYFEGRDYFEMHTVSGNPLTTYVAIDQAKPPLMRPVMTREQALDIIDSMAETDVIKGAEAGGTRNAAVADKVLHEEFDKRLKSCDPRELVPVIKTVYERGEARKRANKAMTMADKRYLDTAQDFLYSELGVALDIPSEDVHDFICQRIEGC